MISFIIIGKNEGKTITSTIRSIISYVDFNGLDDYEIIYVDSKSSDDSINIVKKFKNVRIFLITDNTNAAVASNIGANEAKGDIFIFLDADMEIEKTFYKNIFSDGKLSNTFISGQLKNIFYNENWKVVDTNFLFPNLKKDTFYSTTGGFFIIKRETWFVVNGMKTKYRRSQDLDFGLRLAKKGILLLRKPDIFVTHHTIDYTNRIRIWKMLFDGSFLYSTSVLYRDHLFNKYMYKLLLRNDYSMLLLLISILLSIFSPSSIVFYLIIVAGRSALQLKVKGSTVLSERFIFLVCKDLMALLGLLFFFPKENQLKYKKVN